MSLYLCDICDKQRDDDSSPCSEYNGALACEECMNEIEEEREILLMKLDRDLEHFRRML